MNLFSSRIKLFLLNNIVSSNRILIGDIAYGTAYDTDEEMTYETYIVGSFRFKSLYVRLKDNLKSKSMRKRMAPKRICLRFRRRLFRAEVEMVWWIWKEKTSSLNRFVHSSRTVLYIYIWIEWYALCAVWFNFFVHCSVVSRRTHVCENMLKAKMCRMGKYAFKLFVCVSVCVLLIFFFRLLISQNSCSNLRLIF